MLVLEGLVTTLNVDDSLNISPMGPRVTLPIRQLILRPFQTSTTYHNLKRTGQGVFHVTDDVEMIAQAAIGNPEPHPPTEPARAVAGRILSGACRWYAFRVTALDENSERAEMICDVVDEGHQRDFLGFNRAKNAVLEAAILATRVSFLPSEHVMAQLEALRHLVEKTGGAAEHRAFDFLCAFVQGQAGAPKR